MPTYVYMRTPGTPLRNCQVCDAPFETVQKMSEDALTKCPQCGGVIERIIMAPNLNGAGKLKSPSADRMSKAGFVQYKRKGKGYYEKQFGKGPDAIHG